MKSADGLPFLKEDAIGSDDVEIKHAEKFIELYTIINFIAEGNIGKAGQIWCYISDITGQDLSAEVKDLTKKINNETFFIKVEHLIAQTLKAMVGVGKSVVLKRKKNLEQQKSTETLYERLVREFNDVFNPQNPKKDHFHVQLFNHQDKFTAKDFAFGVKNNSLLGKTNNNFIADVADVLNYFHLKDKTDIEALLKDNSNNLRLIVSWLKKWGYSDCLHSFSEEAKGMCPFLSGKL